MSQTAAHTHKHNNAGHLTSPTYRPDIDGLRAVAVLAVVAFHAFRAKGGYTGVDVFFVISGFLISTIIYGNLERDSFSIVEFYKRRIRRIFPALAVVLVSCCAFGWYVLFVNEFGQLGKHIVGGAGFVSNFVLWGESGYFDSAAEVKPLLHLWSLGIEEQFYIVWPVLLWFVWRRRVSLIGITVFIVFASFAFNIFTVYRDGVAAFYSPLTRFWELLMGALLAYVELHRNGVPSKIKQWAKNWLHLRWPEFKTAKLRNALSLVGFGLIVVGLFIIDKKRLFPGFWALMPTVGAVFVIAGGPKSWINRVILSNRVMVWFGLISFPLYLWHWPILSFMHIIADGKPPSSWRIAAVVASIILSWLTYRFVESHLRFGPNGKQKAIALLAVMASLSCLGFLVKQDVIHSRIYGQKINLILESYNDWEYPKNLKPMEGINGPAYFIKGSRPEATVFFGDSHMEQYSPRITKLLTENKDEGTNTAYFVIGRSCPITPNVYTKDNGRQRLCDSMRNAFNAVMERPEVKTVVIASRWGISFGKSKEAVDEYDRFYKKDGVEENIRTEKGKKLMLAGFEDFLSGLAKTKRVFVLLDNYYGREYDPKSFVVGNRLTKIDIREMDRTVDAFPELAEINKEVASIVKRAGAEVIDPTKILCDGNKCLRMMDDGRPLYKDIDHLRSSYVRESASYLDKVIAQ